jgi:ABC-type amino acid transport system permease subunit
MVIFWVYFLLPAVTGHSINAYVAAVVALTACISAYLAEVVRAGVNSVPRAQLEAAYSTGCSYLQTMRLIVIPQALRNMLPSLVNQFVSAFKTTSLVYIIGVIEFFRAASIVNERDFKSLEIFTFVGVVYFVNCFCMSMLARWYERRLQRKRGEG